MKKLVSLLLVLALVLSVGITVASGEATREVVNLTMLSQPANDAGLQTGNWMGNYLMDELQITIELLPNADGKLEAMLASDSLPDIVIINTGTDKIMNASDSGQLIALSDYEEQLPHAVKNLSGAMRYYAENLSSDGKCYMLSNDVGPVAGGYSLSYAVSLRFDIYADIGYPEIKDAWDYLEVLKQMHEAYPVNEDGQAVYGVGCWNDWDNYLVACGRYTPLITQAGCNGDASELPFSIIDEANGGVLINTLEPDSPFMQGIKWLFTANQMGLLDPDSMTQTWNTFLEKMSAGRYLMTCVTWGNGNYNTAEHMNAEDPSGFMPVFQANTMPHMTTDRLIGSHWAWGIGHNTEHLDRCLEYLDFMCNPDAVFELYNGPKGEAWDVNEEGLPYLTEIGKTALADYSNYTFSEGGRFFNGIDLINSCPIPSSMYSEKYNSIINRDYWATTEKVYSNMEQEWQEYYGAADAEEYLVKNNSWIPYMNLEESLILPMDTDMQAIRDSIGDIVVPACWQAIYAKDEAEFNTIIAAMLDDAYELGLQDLLDDNQARWAAACEMAASIK